MRIGGWEKDLKDGGTRTTLRARALSSFRINFSSTWIQRPPRGGSYKAEPGRVVGTERERWAGLKSRWHSRLRCPSVSLPPPFFLPLSRLSPRSLNSGAINGPRCREISPSCFCPLLSPLSLATPHFSDVLAFLFSFLFLSSNYRTLKREIFRRTIHLHLFELEFNR